ncbi:MAG: exo-alpha-sialidase [Bacteroidales bacterium]
MIKFQITLIQLMLLLTASSISAQIKVELRQPLLPILTRMENNPVVKLDVIKQSNSINEIREIAFNLDGTTNISDIEYLRLYKGKKGALIDDASPIGGTQLSSKIVRFATPISLDSDTTTLWLSIRLKESINLTNRFQIDCERVLTNSRRKVDIEWCSPKRELRAGVALRRKGDDGVHTSRIPGLTTTKQGTLIAVYDARYTSSRDLQGHMDIAINRSFDGGVTWGPMQVVLDMKEWGGLPEKYNGVSDACILVDENSDDIYVAGLWMHGVLDEKSGEWVEGLTNDSTIWIHQWRAKGSQPGVGVKQTSQFIITKSSDDGNSWSEPVNITSKTKRPEWWLYAPAPGHGITLKDGTLVFPTQGRDENGLPFSNITWSCDNGNSWVASNPAYSNTTECMAVELLDGSIMLNMRDNRNRGSIENNGRRICVTSDLGDNWIEHSTSRNALIESTCMASIHRHTFRRDGIEHSILLFCNPESYTRRDHMTLKVSFDDGMTWPQEYKIELDEYSSFGYSCITSIDENTIGVLYEGSQSQMVFQQIALGEILKW